MNKQKKIQLLKQKSKHFKKNTTKRKQHKKFLVYNFKCWVKNFVIKQQQQCEKEEASRKKVEDNLRQKQEAHQNLQQQYDALKNDVASLRGISSIKDQEIQNVQRDLHAEKEKLKLLQQQLLHEKTETKKLLLGNGRLEEKYESLESKYKNLGQEFEGEQTANQNLQQQLQDLRDNFQKES